MKNFKLAHSKSGVSCLWEAGGAYSNHGSAILIADANGAKIKPLYIRTRGELACGDHAMIPVTVGATVVQADQWHGDYDIYVYQIAEIRDQEAIAKLEYHFSCGEWDCPPDDKFSAVIGAAKKKAASYHCRMPYYVLPV
jgi:hypothetical protein